MKRKRRRSCCRGRWWWMRRRGRSCGRGSAACPGWAHVHTIGLRRGGTELGRTMPIILKDANTIEPFYETGSQPVYFKVEDIGAKIIAPSIYNCYIVDVGDVGDTNSGKNGDRSNVGFNSFTKATIQGFEGHREFETGDTRKFVKSD